MLELHLPQYQPPLTKRDGTLFIQCLVRKKWLRLTPEEWVRQHFIHLLYYHKKIPLSVLSIEKGFTLDGMVKRTDIVVYSEGKPQAIVECKAPHIKLDDTTVLQIAQYYKKMNTNMLIITNGMQHLCWKKGAHYFTAVSAEEMLF